jgi:hypothetical protein
MARRIASRVSCLSVGVAAGRCRTPLMVGGGTSFPIAWNARQAPRRGFFVPYGSGRWGLDHLADGVAAAGAIAGSGFIAWSVWIDAPQGHPLAASRTRRLRRPPDALIIKGCHGRAGSTVAAMKAPAPGLMGLWPTPGAALLSGNFPLTRPPEHTPTLGDRVERSWHSTCANRASASTGDARNVATAPLRRCLSLQAS